MADGKGVASVWVVKLAAILLLASVAFVASRGTVSAQDTSMSPPFRDCSDCPEMVVVPPGQFLMGSSDEDMKQDFAATPKDTGFFALFFSNRDLAKKAHASRASATSSLDRVSLRDGPLSHNTGRILGVRAGYTP
ncbi:MAG: hypothetical protein WDN49_08990 [Acetobacteraceae bacterium]